MHSLTLIHFLSPHLSVLSATVATCLQLSMEMSFMSTLWPLSTISLIWRATMERWVRYKNVFSNRPMFIFFSNWTDFFFFPGRYVALNGAWTTADWCHVGWMVQCMSGTHRLASVSQRASSSPVAIQMCPSHQTARPSWLWAVISQWRRSKTVRQVGVTCPELLCPWKQDIGLKSSSTNRKYVLCSIYKF